MSTNGQDEVDSVNKEDFADLSGTMFGDGVKSCSGSPLEDALLVDSDNCGLCGYELQLISRLFVLMIVFCFFFF